MSAGARLVAALTRAGVPLRAEEPLSRHTTLRVGGPVPALLLPADAAQVARAIDVLGELDFPWRVLGAGSNVLAADAGLDFAVVATAALARPPRFDGTRVEADGGCFLPRLARDAAERGLAGLAFAIGIPGSVGGAVRMNAGAWGSQMAAVVESVTAVRVMDGRAAEGPLDPVFAYRTSSVGTHTVVAGVALRLAPADPRVVLADIEKALAERRRTQPTASRSAGCAFRNPPGDSAGRIVDQCGLKGLAHGGAQVSTQHANFIVNRGGATAADVLALLRDVQARVRNARGLELEPEVMVWAGGDAHVAGGGTGGS